MMKRLSQLALLLAIVAALGACNKRGNENYPYTTRYLPVVLEGSQKWSILDVESGEVVAENAFKNAPSAIVGDKFNVHNDDGSVDYYNMSDLKHPINKEHFASGTEFSEDGYAVASRKGGNLQVIDGKCNVVADLGDSIVSCSVFARGLAVACGANGKYGYVDTKGKIAIALKYDQCVPFAYDDHAMVATVRDTAFFDFSFIDKRGKELFSSNSTMYGPEGTFKHGVMACQKRDTVVCLNAEGKEVADPAAVPGAVKKDFDQGGREGGGNYIVVKGDKMGVVDGTGQQILSPKFVDIIDLSTTRFLMSEQQGSYYLADKKGNKVGKAKIIAFNGNTGAVAQIGKVDPASVAYALLQQLSTVAAMPKETRLSTFYNLLDGVHPERYEGQNAIPTQIGVVAFAGPIVSKTPEGNFTFNLQTPVTCVTLGQDVGIYPNDTEQKVIDLMTMNMGKAGFVSMGDNTFAGEAGGAVALGYKDGAIAVYYYLDKSQAKPLPCVARK